MLSYSTERYDEIMPDALALTAEHCAESEAGLPYTPNLSAYQAFDETGVLHITAARNDGRLVGYVLALVTPSMHTGLLTATIDAFFLERGVRRGWAGVRLLREAEKALIARGVRRLFGGCKSHHDLSAIFQRLGWTPTEIYFEKVV